MQEREAAVITGGFTLEELIGLLELIEDASKLEIYHSAGDVVDIGRRADALKLRIRHQAGSCAGDCAFCEEALEIER